MLFDIEVRHDGEGDYFQMYSETVEAATAQDAISRVQRKNPGCYVHCTNSYNAPYRQSTTYGGEGGGFLVGIAILGLIIIGVLVEYWYIAVPLVAGLLFLYLWDKFKN